ncbi:hypothetical protein ACRU43_12875 [Mycobacterium colombiense]
MTNAVIISDPLRVPITAERRADGGVVVRGHFRGVLALSDGEINRLTSFALNKAHIQRYTANPPAETIGNG